MLGEITLGDILQFGAMGVLTIVLFWVFGTMQKALDSKDRQIETLTTALIDTKLNAKALEIMTAQLQAIMPYAAAGMQSVAVQGFGSPAPAGGGTSVSP